MRGYCHGKEDLVEESGEIELSLSILSPGGQQMDSSFTASASIDIGVGAARVWEALTDPALIKRYLYGTDAVSDWKVGGSIVYKGVWEGKAYEDRGRIEEVLPGKRLRIAYWSAFSGLPDSPENYSPIEYDLVEAAGRTKLSIRQGNNATIESADRSAANWVQVLRAMKEILET
jgi:uncharacterized protein YndB with AHSA1/START domain